MKLDATQVTGDNVSALAFCDVDDDSKKEMLVGAENEQMRELTTAQASEQRTTKDKIANNTSLHVYSLTTKDGKGDGATVFVGGVSFRATEDDVRRLFENAGYRLQSLRMPLDMEKGQPRGFAFVEFASSHQSGFYDREEGGVCWYRILRFQGSFSAVSKPNFAREYSLESSRRDLHNARLCTVL